MSKQIGIIADDLTGANDSGVQLAKKGLSSTVLLDYEKDKVNAQSDVLIVDTDSRAKMEKDAYQAVYKAASLLFQWNNQHVYKKVDSTLRGNIGAEVAALEKVYHPDLVVFAPAYPKMNRQTIQGHHYVNGILITDTEFGKDPKTPVTESYIPNLLKGYANGEVALVNTALLQESEDRIIEYVEDVMERGSTWIACDSETEEDLEQVANIFAGLKKRIVWVGSAGLIEYLPDVLKLEPSVTKADEKITVDKTLIVSGSLSNVTMNQLRQVRELSESMFLEVDPKGLVSESVNIESIVQQINKQNDKKYIVLYVEASLQNRMGAIQVGEKLGLSRTQVSEVISKGLGMIAEVLLDTFSAINGLVLTGGDTAKAVCSQLGIDEMELHSEVEPGLPFGQLRSEDKRFWAVTKAGGFGTQQSLVNAIKYMTGKVEQNESK